MGEHQHAAFDDAADDGDMAERQAAGAREHDDRADLRIVAADVAPLRLVPPCPGIAVDLDTGGGAGEGDALADIVEQAARRGRGDLRRHREQCSGIHAASGKYAPHAQRLIAAEVTARFDFMVNEG